MREINIHPMPLSYRQYRKFRPRPGPIFLMYSPTIEELEVTLALFDALDPESQEWYGGEQRRIRLKQALQNKVTHGQIRSPF